MIKDLSIDDIDKNSYEGAIVFVPQPGIYFEPVVVMDYNSLYPSSMIAENISHDSIVGFKEYGLMPKKMMSDPDNYELVKDTVVEKYDNLEGYHYIDIEYDIFQGVDSDKKKVGYKVCRFAEADNGDKSVLPRILRKLLKARKDTRKIMEYKTLTLNDGSEVSGVLSSIDDEKYELFNVVSGKSVVEKSFVINITDTNNDFQKSVLDGLQLAYKVTCNSLYGQVGATTSPICYKELAACTTATGRKMVVTARDLTLNTFVGAKLTYGDSVTGDTPLCVMINGFVDFIPISELNNEWFSYEEFKRFDSNRSDKQQTSVLQYKIWTNEGWSKINRVIRHKTKKAIYRVITGLGSVDVTEDHSLLGPTKELIKPTECVIGTELLHGFPQNFPELMKYQQKSKNQMIAIIDDIHNGMIDKVPYEILNATRSDRKMFVKLFFDKKQFPRKLRNNEQRNLKLLHQSLYYLVKSVEFDLSIILYNDAIEYLGLNFEINAENIKVKSVSYLFDTNQETNQETNINSEKESESYVYDIETESGNFQAGIGQLIVKNTDSIFINFTDVIKNRYPNREFTEKDLLKESIVLGEEAAANINKHMKSPQNIEYEKTFWPFCIFSKKRYFGNKYEHNIEKYKQTSMGIVLKRRDNALIVKTIYGGVIDIILNKRDIEASKKFFYNSIKELLEGKVDLSQLVISKTVRTDYANPNQIAHKVLADRMGDRDPGNRPQSNDRIPYCYIDTCNILCKLCSVKVNPDQCKCINCMNIYCYYHLNNHRESCIKVCRFCKMNSSQTSLTNCLTCTAWYCNKCFEKHKLRTDKYKVTHNDKCKKKLTNKLLQGDTIEHPQYIAEKKLKIDYNYYLTHQIENPVYQIFELVMKNPSSIIGDLVRKMNNTKNGNHTINDWLNAMSKKKTASELGVDDKFSLLKKIDLNEQLKIDDETNMLGDQFEEEEENNMDFDIIDFDNVDII